jgi:outer membrane murein-binding lipoprotein Lpp
MNWPSLRQAFNLWQNKVLRAFAVVFVLLAIIGGSVWWFGSMQHHEIQQISADARHITREKIRAQLLESVDGTRKDALAQAEKAEGWKERERLSQAAEKAYAGSVSRIDELAASFAEIEGTDRSTDVFDKMTRILADEGVDQALAYVATQRPGILEKVKARTAATSEKNRTELLPLLNERPARDRTQSSCRGRTPLQRNPRAGAGLERAAKRIRLVSDPARPSDRTGTRQR